MHPVTVPVWEGKADECIQRCCNRYMALADEDATPTASAQSAKPPLNSTRPSSQSKKHNKPAKPTSAADARSKAVYQAMEHLLEQGAMSDAYLLQAVTSLCGDDFLQVMVQSYSCNNNACTYVTDAARVPLQGTKLPFCWLSHKPSVH